MFAKMSFKSLSYSMLIKLKLYLTTFQMKLDHIDCELDVVWSLQMNRYKNVKSKYFIFLIFLYCKLFDYN